MALINFSVYDTCCHCTVVPWTIHQLEDERVSLKQLYHRMRPERAMNHEIQEVRVGSSKDSLDPVSNPGTEACILLALCCRYIKA